jgi:hypothetical protein
MSCQDSPEFVLRPTPLDLSILDQLPEIFDSVESTPWEKLRIYRNRLRRVGLLSSAENSPDRGCRGVSRPAGPTVKDQKVEHEEQRRLRHGGIGKGIRRQACSSLSELMAGGEEYEVFVERLSNAACGVWCFQSAELLPCTRWRTRLHLPRRSDLEIYCKCIVSAIWRESG